MSGCEHNDFEAQVNVGRITHGDGEDVVQFIADVAVRCRECGQSFGFRGPPGGHSWREPRCAVDAQTIHLPLMSPTELALAGALPALARGPMVYEVNP